MTSVSGSAIHELSGTHSDCRDNRNPASGSKKYCKATVLRLGGALAGNLRGISIHWGWLRLLLASLLISFGFSVAKEVSGGFYLEVPYVKQVNNFCGPASLAMVLRYWGQETSQYDLAQHIQPFPKKGLSGSQLKELAEESGFSAFSFAGRTEDILNHLRQGRPLIIALGPSLLASSNHYVVLVGWDEPSREWIFHDPAVGPYRRRSEEKLSKKRAEVDYWTLLIVPTEAR